MFINKILHVVIGLMLSAICMASEIKMPAIFADHMVLQQGQKVPVWGTTDARATVKVLFARQEKVVVADNEGNWQISLAPLKASSESRVMSISSKLDGETVDFKISDVLVGEVWFAGGQSNMYRPFRMLVGEARDPKYEPIAEYLRQEEANANDSLLRQFRVSKAFSVLEEKNSVRGDWSVAVKGPVHEFCGTAYFFARELRRKLNVPVAIIACNLGGTKVEPWIPMDAYQKNKTLKDFYKDEISNSILR
jgi:sialate O-acetylesterase